MERVSEKAASTADSPVQADKKKKKKKDKESAPSPKPASPALAKASPSAAQIEKDKKKKKSGEYISMASYVVRSSTHDGFSFIIVWFVATAQEAASPAPKVTTDTSPALTRQVLF